MNATTWVLFGTLLAAVPAASAEPPQIPAATVPPGRDEDEKAIRASVDAFNDSFAKGDAKAIATMFTEQGEAIDTEGEPIRGREALEAHYTERFAANPGEKLETAIDLIHFLAPEVVRLDGRSTLVPASGASGQPSTSRFSATLIKNQGRWRIASVREIEDASVTHHERLKELDWLVGEWIEETGDAVISTTIAWSEDGNFLLRSFEIKVAGKADLKGTQRIGWDPLTKQIKSWVFDSRGGYGDGFWSRSGEEWIIKSVGVRPDGLTTSATQILTRVNKDRLLWRLKGPDPRW